MDGVEITGEGLKIKDARNKAFSYLFAHIAENAMAPPRELVPPIQIRTNVDLLNAVRVLEKQMPKAKCTTEPVYTSKDKNEVKKYLAKYHVNGKIYHGSAHTPAEAKAEAAWIAVDSLGIMDDPDHSPEGTF